MSELRKYLSQMLDEDEVNKAIDIHERQLEEAREAIYKYAEIALMEGKGEFGHSWEDFKFYVLDEQLKEQEK